MLRTNNAYFPTLGAESSIQPDRKSRAEGYRTTASLAWGGTIIIRTPNMFGVTKDQ
jgi:hypothetical protein